MFEAGSRFKDVLVSDKIGGGSLCPLMDQIKEGLDTHGGWEQSSKEASLPCKVGKGKGKGPGKQN